MKDGGSNPPYRKTQAGRLCYGRSKLPDDFGPGGVEEGGVGGGDFGFFGGSEVVGDDVVGVGGVEDSCGGELIFEVDQNMDQIVGEAAGRVVLEGVEDGEFQVERREIEMV